MIEELKRARKVGVPLVAIQTPDPWQTLSAIKALANGTAPAVAWDIVRGFKPLNTHGNEWTAKLLTEAPAEQYAIPIEALKAAETLPEDGILILMNMSRLLEDAPTIQGISNLRNPYKSNGRTLVILGPDFTMPAELAHDVLIIDEPLPTPEEIGATMADLYQAAEADVDDQTKERAIDAMRGLPAFAVEQAGALALRAPKGDAKASIDLGSLWEKKRRAISQVAGLNMEPPAETFDDLGGLASIKEFYARYFAGRARPKLIVFIDEIEKTMGGAGTQGAGDSSGTSQDALKVLLTEMQDRKYSGSLYAGPGGSGKTMMARAAASTFGVPCVALDLGAAKGSLVGQSEARIRAALKTIHAIAGDKGAFFVGTCNRMETLPPELQRRFRAGIWFFDLPDAEERSVIGALQAKKYDDLGDECQIAAYFADAKRDGWSPANIADCAFMAHAMSISLAEAAEYVVPAATQAPEALQRLRALASGRFLSASKRGRYTMPAEKSVTEAPTKPRRVSFGE